MSTPVDVTVRYWAGARAAAGLEQETVRASDTRELRSTLATAHPALEPVLEVASLLLDGRAVRGDEPLTEGVTVEVLPPFAGG